MPKTRQQKSQIKDRLAHAFQTASSAMFADYQGLNAAKADELRKVMRAEHILYVVAKKTLLSLAAKASGISLDAKKLPGMLGVAFGTEDDLAPARSLGAMSKRMPIKLVGGIFEGEVISQEKALALSLLPSKKELLGRVVGTIYAPVSAFVRALGAIQEQKSRG